MHVRECARVSKRSRMAFRACSHTSMYESIATVSGTLKEREHTHDRHTDTDLWPQRRSPLYSSSFFFSLAAAANAAVMAARPSAFALALAISCCFAASIVSLAKFLMPSPNRTSPSTK